MQQLSRERARELLVAAIQMQDEAAESIGETMRMSDDFSATGDFARAKVRAEMLRRLLKQLDTGEIQPAKIPQRVREIAGIII
jgi:hypothetical protein